MTNDPYAGTPTLILAQRMLPVLPEITEYLSREVKRKKAAYLAAAIRLETEADHESCPERIALEECGSLLEKILTAAKGGN